MRVIHWIADRWDAYVTWRVSKMPNPKVHIARRGGGRAAAMDKLLSKRRQQRHRATLEVAGGVLTLVATAVWFAAWILARAS